ncbi:hypothetical protein PTI98_012917 [Pleurotus ostreatus]|nr:hypothetical protein PTI98_012917 [Pleurotus ostreatus]
MATTATATDTLEAVDALYIALSPISNSRSRYPQVPRRTSEYEELRRLPASSAAPLATESSFEPDTARITNEIHVYYIHMGDQYSGVFCGGVVGGRANHNIHIGHSALPEDPLPAGTLPVITITAIIVGVVSVVGWHVFKK